VAVLAVAFGVAGAMGMGVFQIRSGLATLVGWDPHSPLVATLVIAALGVAYTASAATRLERGIQWLSGANMLLALAFLGAVLFGGRTTVLLQTWATSVVDYAVALPGLTLALPPWNDVAQWREDWTLTYLIWWVAWAPFVGVCQGATEPPRTRKLVWGLMLGVLASALVASNDIDVVKAVSIAGAIPFTLVLLLQLWALVRVLRREPR
jgi:glycine betaine transporter